MPGSPAAGVAEVDHAAEGAFGSFVHHPADAPVRVGDLVPTLGQPLKMGLQAVSHPPILVVKVGNLTTQGEKVTRIDWIGSHLVEDDIGEPRL
jgi:hypothetical protein